MEDKPKLSELMRRERQIMEVIYRRGEAAAAEVVEALPGEHKNATIYLLPHHSPPPGRTGCTKSGARHVLQGIRGARRDLDPQKDRCEAQR